MERENDGQKERDSMARPGETQAGERSEPERRREKQRADYHVCRDHHELRIYVNLVTDTLVEAVEEHWVELALVEEGPVMLLVFRFMPGMVWSPAVCEGHQVVKEKRPASGTPGRDERTMLEIMLIETDGGRVAATREVSLSPEFSREVHDAACRQAEGEWGEEERLDKTLRLLKSYPEMEGLVELTTARRPVCRWDEGR